VSFTSMKIDELRKIAETFGVDQEEAKNKQDLIALIGEEGITYEMYEKFTQAESIKKEVKDQPKHMKLDNNKDLILVKMDRENPRYDVMGYTFTSENPFIAMPEEKAQKIFDSQEGFRMATPKEVQEFYS
jgi:hypothetical protein